MLVVKRGCTGVVEAGNGHRGVGLRNGSSTTIGADETARIILAAYRGIAVPIGRAHRPGTDDLAIFQAGDGAGVEPAVRGEVAVGDTAIFDSALSGQVVSNYRV